MRARVRGALTNGEAVGPSRIASSSGVKGRRGITYIRTGTSRKMTSGNPIAAVSYIVSSLIDLRQRNAHTNSLCDGERRGEAEELDADKKRKARGPHAPERLGRGHQAPVTEEVVQLGRNTILRKCTKAHVPAVISSALRSLGTQGETHKRPASTPRGMRASTCRNGPVRRTRQSAPCARFDTRCSTTASGTSSIPVDECTSVGSGGGSRSLGR
jgi:hypothetical protein